MTLQRDTRQDDAVLQRHVQTMEELEQEAEQIYEEAKQLDEEATKEEARVKLDRLMKTS